MKVSAIRSDGIYSKIMSAPLDKKNDIYRYELMYGEDKARPWVTKTDMTTLNEYIKPIIQGGLNVQGFENLNAYLYGDELAKLQNFPQVGLPYCAGYAYGYHLVKHYLKNW